MASHIVSWASGAHAHSGNLDLLITVEGGLARAPTPVQPLRFASLEATIEALKKL
jgi:hypothetical protein